MRKIVFMFLVSATLVCSACSNNSDTGEGSSEQISNNTEPEESVKNVITGISEEEIATLIDNGAEVSDKSDNFEITNGDSGYTLVLKDKDGNELQNIGTSKMKPVVAEYENGLLEIFYTANIRTAYAATCYYNPETAILSEVFLGVQDVYGTNIVMIKDASIIVQDIYDTSKLYKEITEFSEELSPVSDVFINVEFSEDGSSVIVTYYAGNGCTETTETIALN